MMDRIKAGTLPLAVLTYAALAFAMSPGTFHTMVLSYFGQAIVLPIILLIGLPAVAIVLRPKAPTTLMLEILRSGGLRLMIVLIIFSLGMAAFTTFKLAIPHLVPFYADPFLARADAWLHGGDPGVIAHMLVPDWAQYPLGYLYGPVWFMLWFGLLAFVTLHNDAALRQRYFWAMGTTVCLVGTVAATALSSAGPIFYADFVEPDRFAGLVSAIHSSAIGDYMAEASGYLLASYHSGLGRSGGGISAMPSMHLAVVTLNAWMLGSVHRLAGLVGWTYVALILLGSVYLGWHYALDGYVSILTVSLIWWGVGHAIRRAANTRQPHPLPAGAIADRP